MSVEGAEGPLQARHGECGPEARADCAFGLSAGEMRRPNAGRQRQPGRDLKLVVDESRNQTSGRMLDGAERRIAAAVMKDHAEGLVIFLVEAIQSGLEIVFCNVRAETGLPAAVRGRA